MEAFKSLIHTSIDESLIKQGVDQIMTTTSGDVRKSGPTIIEKLCASVESLLNYRYAAVWDVSFQVVAAMFDKLGESSSYLLKGTLSLEHIQMLSHEDFPYRKQLHDCMGIALVALGPETFLSFLHLNVEEAEDLSDANVWLFPILKHNIVGAHLSFFSKSILNTIRVLKLKSAKHEHQGRIHSARNIDGLVYSLWSLLPSFCNYPKSFNDLKKALCCSHREESDFRGVICSSLQILIQQNKRIVEGENEPSGFGKEVTICKQRAVSCYTSEFAASNLEALRSSAPEILTTLSGIFIKSSKDDGGSLQRTIGEFASIADKSVVSRIFKSGMHKLLKVTEEAGDVQNAKGFSSMEIDDSSNEASSSLARAQLYDLAVSLLPGLGTEEVDLLFIAIKPALEDAEGSIQKKAYKVLSTILEHADGFITRKLEELLKLMFQVMHSCHSSAKRHRLNCLYFLILHVSKGESEQMKRDIVVSFSTEIVLGLKETNMKTRNIAYEIIAQIGHAFVDENKGGNKENLRNFFNTVTGGLAGATPHMISAAVKGIARLACEFNDLVSVAFNVLPSTSLLLQRKNQEVIKANLGLLKVLVAKSQAKGLQNHMKGMVEALLSWQGSNKNHFKAKVKLLLEMLVKKCGIAAVKEVMPQEHMKLLTNIIKTKERNERKHAANTEETISRVSKATTSRWNHTKVFSDFGDEETDDGNSEKSLLRSKRARKSLPEDTCDQEDDEPLDLLDHEKTRLSLGSSSEHRKRKPQSDDEPEIDADGRLIIREDGSTLKTDTPAGLVHSRKRRKTTECGRPYTGSEYSIKKAGRDLKRKGKLEPYAYWSLNRKMVSRRPKHRAAARKGMSNALSVKGLKLKRGQKKSNKKQHFNF